MIDYAYVYSVEKSPKSLISKARIVFAKTFVQLFVMELLKLE